MDNLGEDLLADFDDEPGGINLDTKALTEGEQNPKENKKNNKKKSKSKKESSQTMDNSGGDQDRIEELQRLIREEESNIVRQYRALCDDVDTVFLRIIAQNRAAYEAVIEQMTFKQKENLAKLMDNNAEISGLWDNLQTGIRYMDGVAASNELGV